MPTVVETLSEETRENLHLGYRGVYLDGECYEFAAALSQLTGWQIVALKTPDHDFRHALVRDPEGGLWDVRGFLTDDEVGGPFSVAGPYDLREVALEDLRKVRPVLDQSIRRAKYCIELIWPDLPFVETARIVRYTAFMNELEKLSRRHGVWLRAPVPAKHQWPALAEEDGDEAGYTMAPVESGNTYIIDRRLR